MLRSPHPVILSGRLDVQVEPPGKVSELLRPLHTLVPLNSNTVTVPELLLHRTCNMLEPGKPLVSIARTHRPSARLWLSVAFALQPLP